jgi:hypothetical protein
VCFEIPFFKKCLSAIFYGTEVLPFTFVFVHMDLKPLLTCIWFVTTFIVTFIFAHF